MNFSDKAEETPTINPAEIRLPLLGFKPVCHSLQKEWWNEIETNGLGISGSWIYAEPGGGSSAGGFPGPGFSDTHSYPHPGDDANSGPSW